MPKASSHLKSAGGFTPRECRASARKLIQSLNRGGYSHGRIVMGEGPTSEAIPVPEEALRALADLLDGMAEGRMPRRASNNPDEMLTTTQAADLIGVSRPFLIKQMKGGLLPHRKVGNRHQISRRDVMKYKRSLYRSRAKALDELSALDQELGFV